MRRLGRRRNRARRLRRSVPAQDAEVLVIDASRRQMQTRRHQGTKKTSILFFLLVLAAPRVALACPVCFGQNDSPLAAAINMGIVFMLVVVAGVLTAFASF